MTDPRFAKFVLLVNASVPAALLAWDACYQQLGPYPANRAIHITGATAIIFIALTLAVTPLRKITGWNWLSHFRRMLGLFAFFYALAHLTIYFFTEGGGSITTVVSDTLNHQFILFGMAALLLMVPLAITSTSGMIKRLGAARWKRLHQLVYVVAVLAAIHFWENGKIVTPAPKIFAAVLAVLLGYRVFQWQRTQHRKARALTAAR